MQIIKIQKLKNLYFKLSELVDQKTELIILENQLRSTSHNLSFENSVENIFKITIKDLLEEIERNKDQISDKIKSIYQDIRNIE